MFFKIPTKIPNNMPDEVRKSMTVEEEIAYYRKCVAEGQETVPNLSEKAIKEVMSGLRWKM